MSEGFLVTDRIDGANPKLPEYPLLPDDLLVRERDGTWWKEAPGLAVGGFVLTDQQESTLRPTQFHRHGLNYTLTSDVTI